LTHIDPVILVQLAAAVERCGIAPDQFEISYEDYLQSDEIRILSSTLNDEQIDALQSIEGTPPFPIVTFLSRDVLDRSSLMSRERHRRESREWLRQRGLLDRLPLFYPNKEQPMQFARRLEEFCGIEPGAVFEMNEQLNIITPKRDWIGQTLRRGWLWRKLHGARHKEEFELLIRAMSASNAEEHGVRLGFIGNEYVPDKENG
jgi:hypothetical protein